MHTLFSIKLTNRINIQTESLIYYFNYHCRYDERYKVTIKRWKYFFSDWFISCDLLLRRFAVRQ